MFVHQNHAAGGVYCSIMVGMVVCLCLASQKPSEREFFVPVRTDFGVNSLTAKSVPAGTKNSCPVGFYSRNSTESTLHHKHNNHKHHHHGGAVCPSYGVGSMDTPDRTRQPSSKGVGRGGVEADNLNR